MRVGQHGARQRLRDEPLQAGQVEDVVAAQPRQHLAHLTEERFVPVGLPEPDDPVFALDLDDAAQRERLVHAHDVEQRRVGERDRGQHHIEDLHQLSAFNVVKPSSTTFCSRSICSGVGSTSGGRTEPTLSPRSRAAALTSDTAKPGDSSRSATSGR